MTEPRTVCLDFDGVLHSYVSGWTGPEPTDPPVPGSQDMVRWLQAEGYEVVVSSVRADDPAGEEGIRIWLTENGFPEIDVTSEKPSAILYVDDNGYRFEGDFAALRAFLEAEPAPSTWVDDLGAV